MFGSAREVIITNCGGSGRIEVTKYYVHVSESWEGLRHERG